MATRIEVWTHGNSMNVEDPNEVYEITHTRSYTRVTGRPFTKNGFHYSVSTSTTDSGNRLRLAAVFVRFRVSAGASLAGVYVMDGERQIAHFGQLRSSPRRWTNLRLNVSGEHRIRHGLGVSLDAGFGERGTSRGALKFEVAGVGCELVG